MPRVVESCENEVLRIIHRCFFRLRWHVLAKVFDGLIAERSPSATASVQDAMRKAQDECRACGWHVVLTEKPLHGLQDKPLPSVTEARRALVELKGGRGMRRLQPQQLSDLELQGGSSSSSNSGSSCNSGSRDSSGSDSRSDSVTVVRGSLLEAVGHMEQAQQRQRQAGLGSAAVEAFSALSLQEAAAHTASQSIPSVGWDGIQTTPCRDGAGFLIAPALSTTSEEASQLVAEASEAVMAGTQEAAAATATVPLVVDGGLQATALRQSKRRSSAGRASAREGAVQASERDGRGRRGVRSRGRLSTEVAARHTMPYVRSASRRLSLHRVSSVRSTGLEAAWKQARMGEECVEMS